MRILGIDVATKVTGWAVYDDTNNSIEFGKINASLIEKIEDRLCHLYEVLHNMIPILKPDMIAVEDQYYSKNMLTLKALSQSRGIVMLVASQLQLPIKIISPSTAKKAISGSGKADKKEVLNAVIDKFNASEISFDEADAAAVAYAAFLETKDGDVS